MRPLATGAPRADVFGACACIGNPPGADDDRQSTPGGLNGCGIGKGAWAKESESRGCCVGVRHICVRAYVEGGEGGYANAATPSLHHHASVLPMGGREKGACASISGTGGRVRIMARARDAAPSRARVRTSHDGGSVEREKSVHEEKSQKAHTHTHTMRPLAQQRFDKCFVQREGLLSKAHAQWVGGLRRHARVNARFTCNQ